MTITAINTTMPGVDPDGVGMKEVNFAARNVDVIVLHPNATDIQLRAKYEAPFLPLDGLMSQAGEVRCHDRRNVLVVAARCGH